MTSQAVTEDFKQASSQPIFESCFAGYNAKKENSRARLQNLFHTNHKPKDWVQTNFQEHDSGMKFRCFRSDAKNPWLEIRFVLGFKATALAYERGVKLLNMLGISVVMMELPNPKKETDYMHPYMRGTHRFLHDDTLPAHATSLPRIPRLALDHSTGGLIWALNELDVRKRDQNDRIFIGAVHMASFFGLPGVTKRFDPRKRAAYRYLTSGIDPMMDIAETRIGRAYNFYSWATGDPSIYSSYGNPIPPQVDELEAYADYAITAIENDPPQTSLTNLYIIPKKDKTACPRSLKYVAELQGGETFSVKNFHNPWLESPDKFTRKIIEFALKQLGSQAILFPIERAKSYLEESYAAKNGRKWLKPFRKVETSPFPLIHTTHTHAAILIPVQPENQM